MIKKKIKAKVKTDKPTLEDQVMELLPKEPIVIVKYLKPLGGIKAGEEKKLPIALATRMEKRGELKIIQS